MKINPIMFYSAAVSVNSEKQSKNNEKTTPMDLISYPKEYYLSFKGGKSLELQQTVSQLQKGKDNFPPDIEKMALDEIVKGNPKNKKLVDIHKEKYRELNDCDNLEELKFFFPEFSKVKSLDEDEIAYNKGSLIDKFLKGEIKTKTGELFLNPQKDLSLQLIQMYWADCLSLNDIFSACGHNFNSTMEKLGIPILKPIYGQYLKLSDADANKAITEAAARNRSLNENNIKRKGIPLSEEHKKKISEGLKKYHQQHPNIDFLRTNEDALYFARNPYQSAIFTEILKRAWNYHDAKSIKKALSRHMKKTNGEVNEEVLQDPNQSLILKEFWNRNQWARDKWSFCMTKSWNRQKVLDKMGLIHEPKKLYPILGTLFTEVFAEALKNNDNDLAGFEIKDIKDMLSIVLPDKQGENKPNSTSLRNIFEQYGQTVIDCYLDYPCYTLPKILDNILKIQIENSQNKQCLSSDSQKILNEMKIIRKTIDKKLINNYLENRTPEGLLKVFDMYVNVASACLTSDFKEINNLFNETMTQLFKLKPGNLSNSMQSALIKLNSAATEQDKQKIQEEFIKNLGQTMRKF